MKKQIQILVSVFLLLSISWQCSARTYIYVSFKLNQKQLAVTVCENKDKPKSCCEAKCHLEKEIKKENKRQSDSPTSIKDKVDKSELSTEVPEFYFFQNILLQSIYSPHKQVQKIEFVYSVFHPPAFI